MSASTMVAKGTGFVKGNRQKAQQRLSKHLSYVEYRSMAAGETQEGRALFSAQRDHVSRQDALEDVLHHTSVRVNFHKLLLSPGAAEPVSDVREWTRQVLADLAERKGVRLHWYACVHRNTAHPHVHLVLAGAGEEKRTGRPKTVLLERADWVFLRERGHERSDAEHQKQLEAIITAQDQAFLTERVEHSFAFWRVREAALRLLQRLSRWRLPGRAGGAARQQVERWRAGQDPEPGARYLLESPRDHREPAPTQEQQQAAASRSLERERAR